MRSLAVLAIAATGCDVLFRLDPVTTTPDAPSGTAALTCEQPVPALDTKPAIQLAEPSLDETNTVMLVRGDGATTMYETTRPSPTSSFGAITAATLVPGTIQDPALFSFEGKPYALGAQGPSPRKLVLCPDPSANSTCVPIALVDTSTTAAITDDVDGPTVALRDSQLVLVFSRGPDLYAATATDSTLLTWMATRLELGDFSLDDGALTSDGSLLIAPAGDVLFAYRWDDQASTYVAAGMINIGGSSPDIGVEDADQIELVVTRRDRGILEPYLARCRRR
jgi:hypothetical protein